LTLHGKMCIFKLLDQETSQTEFQMDVLIQTQYGKYQARPKHTKKSDDYIFCLFWYEQQQNPYNL
jgi:hypothetical protein